MSGGSWNYAYQRVDMAADDLRQHETGDDELRQRLAEHMRELAVVMKAIEWADSADTSADSWIEPTREFLTKSDDGFRQEIEERAAAVKAAKDAGLTDYQIELLRK